MRRDTITIGESKVLTGENKVGKVIALWGFCEATLGGILHAFNIPFTGLFVGSAAVLLISLIAVYSKQKGMILKATLLVLTIKGIVSPHTPLTAYAAVLLQGLAGQLLFSTIKQHKLAAFLFGITAMLLSGFQKLIILTIIFGNTLWESIDIYSSFVINQFISTAEHPEIFNLSIVLMSIYIGIHFITGIIAGYAAGKLPAWIDTAAMSEHINLILEELEEIKNNNHAKKKKRSWWRKKSGVAFIVMMIIMLGLSYLYPEFGNGNVSQIAIMILRSTLIMVIWFFILSPIFLKIFRRFLNRQQKSYSLEIENIILLFPHIKCIVKNSWDNTKEMKKLKRLKKFLSTAVVLVLISDYD